MRRRLLGSYLALTVVVLAALEIPLAVTYASRERDRLEAGLTKDAFVLASLVEDALEKRQALDLQSVATSYQARSDARVVIVDATGQLVADSDATGGSGDGTTDTVEPRSFADRPEMQQALANSVATGTRTSDTLGTELFYVAVPVSSGGVVHGAVRLTYSTEQLDERVHRYWATLAAVAAVSLVAATGVGLVLARWVSRPVDRLRDAALRLGGGALDARADEDDGPPEIRQLARAFNVTAARLGSLLEAQDQFVADASHQLRTPLTALRLRLEMLETELDEDVTVEEAGARERITADVAAARDEVGRLSRLVDGLLALARAERQAPEASSVELDAAEVFAERCKTWAPIAAERGISLESRPNAVRLRATPDRLVQALDNLLANAIEASDEQSAIVLEAHADDATAVLHVRDHGPGMTPEQMDRAFDRFWRASLTRSELGGSGLGLTIVDKLVRADGGTIELRAAEPHGLDAIIRLPGRADRAARSAVSGHDAGQPT